MLLFERNTFWQLQVELHSIIGRPSRRWDFDDALVVPAEDDLDAHRVDAEQWSGPRVATLGEVLTVVQNRACKCCT